MAEGERVFARWCRRPAELAATVERGNVEKTMAIAPWYETEEHLDRAGPLDMPWPRPALHVVACPQHVPGVGRPVDVVLRRARRARRAALQRRRRRVLGAGAVAGLAVALALPLAALGGAPASPPQPGAHAATAGAIVYVVQPGDTLWSIAGRLDGGGDPRPLAEAIARETGSATVVPGERIVVP